MQRREFLQRVGGGAIAFNFSFDPVQSSEPPFPEYPQIPSSELERLGWERTNRNQVEKASGKWSTTEYEWTELQETVRDATAGKIDIPLGGMKAFHISDNAESKSVFGSQVREGDNFLSTGKAKWDLHDPIKNDFQSYLSSFSEEGFLSVEGEMNWSIGPALPTSLGFLSNKCEPSGTLTTEMASDVQMHQFNLEYRLHPQTANINRDVSLQNEVNLEFYGWIAKWATDNHVWAVGAIHPNSTEDFCGLDDPHIEKALTDAVGEEISLNLDKTINGQVHSIMSAVQ